MVCLLDNVEGLRGALDSKSIRGAESELIKVFDEKLEEVKNTINKAYLGYFIIKPASTAPGIGSFWFRVEENNVAISNLKMLQESNQHYSNWKILKKDRAL